MARNGSGTYSLPAGNPVVTGTTISSTVHNTTMSDIATALTGSIAKNGETVWTGADDHNGNEIILDADGDTSLTADTDDQLDFKIGGTDVFSYGYDGTNATVTLNKDLVMTRALGAASNEVNFITEKNVTFSGDAGGSSGVRINADTVTSSGANAIFDSRVHYDGIKVNTTAGDTTTAYVCHDYIWLQNAGTVTSAHVYDAHLRIDGTGGITTGKHFNTVGTTWSGGTGVITTEIGFDAQFGGDATKVTNAYGFKAEDMSAATLVVGYESKIASGTGKWGFRASGSAKNAFAGATRIGDNTVPTDKLEVAGFLKASANGTISTTASWHELKNNIASYILKLESVSGSTPSGIEIKFSAASPDNNTQNFLQCIDSTTTRCIIYSDGDLQNHDNSYGAISDERLKTGIRDSGSQWNDIKAMRVRKYKFKEDGEKGVEHIGLVSQELALTSPGLVSYDAENDVYGIQYSLINLKLLKAFQEAQDKIESLESRVAALESK